MTDKTQFISQQKKEALEAELEQILKEQIPNLAKRIDEARQNGDLSENAEYHAAREDLGWVKGRSEEIKNILQNAEIIDQNTGSIARIGSTVEVKVNGKKREFTVVGAQEADPLSGKISNDSPLGRAFLGVKKGQKIQIDVPAGVQVYEILDVK